MSNIFDFFCANFLYFSGGKINKQLNAVGLHLCLVCRPVSVKLTALVALVDDHKAALRVGLCLDGHEISETFVGTIPGIYVYVYRPKTKRAMIP